MTTTTTTDRYRVVVRTTNVFGVASGLQPKISESTKWEGTDLDELSRHYPPSDTYGADEHGHSEIEGGMIRSDYRFERQREDGSWEEIDDPRRRITPVTYLERKIDAENRRLYPGDYMSEEECGCGSSRCSECNPQDYDNYWCDVCEDRGCQQCDPESFVLEEPCSLCGLWIYVKRLSFEEGLCKQCEDVCGARSR